MVSGVSRHLSMVARSRLLISVEALSLGVSGILIVAAGVVLGVGVCVLVFSLVHGCFVIGVDDAMCAYVVCIGFGAAGVCGVVGVSAAALRASQSAKMCWFWVAIFAL